MAVESDAVRISYFRDGQRVEDSIDAEGASWHLNGKLVDCGPFDDVVLTGRDVDAVSSLLASLDTSDTSTIRMVGEGAALLAYARSVEVLADARALLVLDLGRYGTSAFTLDVAAGQVTRSSRRAALSGEVLDDVVERLVMSKGILPPAQGIDAEREYRAFFRELKELVSTSAGVRAPGNGPMLLTREEFEEAVTAPLLQTLAWAAPDEPDAVLLIGGQARIPLVKALVEQEWTVPLVLPDSPNSVIVEGAALEAQPSAPHLDLDGEPEEHQPEEHQPEQYPGGEDMVLTVDADEDLEPPTTPLRVVAPAPDVSAPTPDVSAPAPDVSAPAPDVAPAPAPVRPASQPAPERSPSRRRIRWSVRDAAGLAGVAAVVVLVWAVVFLRGDTPPPPGIGVEPVSGATSDISVAEGVPPAELPTIPPPALPPPPVDPQVISGEVDSEDSTLETDGTELDDEQFAEVGFGSGTGLDVGN
ncbi:hypothetical protein [Rhodococcus sovatensis]|uniref:Hsp70 protein n=1 Tax=Rhodococcus sovatensis TaxID=1805840 RepID=A0ABZ2PQB9_9NOCA